MLLDCSRPICQRVYKVNFETFLGFSHPKLKSFRVFNFYSFYIGRGGELEEEDI